jgi:hypothetical protein
MRVPELPLERTLRFCIPITPPPPINRKKRFRGWHVAAFAKNVRIQSTAVAATGGGNE